MKKKTQKKHDKYNVENTDLDFSTCSAYDCTGLIPAVITQEGELENYEELYPYLPPGNSTEH